jgi:hypothetical protein
LRILISTLSKVALAAVALALSASPALAGDGPEAQASGVTQASAADGAEIFVDLVAADFFESDLRLAQSRRIEADTAHRYLELDETARARFRSERKQLWRKMSETERQALRGAKRPLFDNLDETQKETFRQIAAQELGGAPGSIRGRGDI